MNGPTASPVPPSAPSERLPFPLQEGETVTQVCRRHWIYLWPNIAVMLMIALVPAIALGVALSAAGGYHGLGARIFWVVSVVWLAYWGVRMLLAWYRYRHDIWVITSQRLVDSLKRNPFSLHLSTADLVNIQDMTVERVGLLRTALDYGDVLCQTAADLQEFRISGVHHPREIQALVDRERDRERTRVR